MLLPKQIATSLFKLTWKLYRGKYFRSRTLFMTNIRFQFDIAKKALIEKE